MYSHLHLLVPQLQEEEELQSDQYVEYEHFFESVERSFLKKK